MEALKNRNVADTLRNASDLYLYNSFWSSLYTNSQEDKNEQ